MSTLTMFLGFRKVYFSEYFLKNRIDTDKTASARFPIFHTPFIGPYCKQFPGIYQ